MLHLLLDAHVVNDEEETLLSSIPQNWRKNISLVQHQSTSSSQWGLFLVKSQQVPFFVVLLLPSIGVQNLSHPVFTHILRRNSEPRVSIDSVQRPNSDLNSILTVRVTGCKFQYGSNFGVPLDPCFLVVMLLLLSEECIHDKPLHEIVRDLQCLSS